MREGVGGDIVWIDQTLEIVEMPENQKLETYETVESQELTGADWELFTRLAIHSPVLYKMGSELWRLTHLEKALVESFTPDAVDIVYARAREMQREG